jgi:thiosulfate dehydrogenase
MQQVSMKQGRFRTAAGLILGAMLSTYVASVGATSLSGPLAKTVAQGKDIFLHDTFGGRGMTCDSCHTGGGLGPTSVPGSGMQGPSLSNAAAVFPRFKPDDGRVMTLADEIHGCIQGALGGKAPAYDSDTMRALETYVTSLAQGKRLDMGGKYK